MSKESPDIFIELFEYIQGRLLCNPAYSLKEKSREKIEKFLSVNEISNIWDYLTFLFSYQTNQYSRWKCIPLKMFLSKNALKRWKERNEVQMFIASKFVATTGLLNPITNVYENSRWSERYLEEQRQKWFNDPRGYVHCDSFGGILYNEEKCKSCKFNYLCTENH